MRALNRPGLSDITPHTWGYTSRLYDRADEGHPEKFVLDLSIGWQNYPDEHGIWHPAEPGFSEPDGDGFSAQFTRMPRLIRLTDGGAKRVYPVPGNDNVWVQLFKPEEIKLGKPTSKVGGVWTWDRPAYTFKVIVGPSGVKFMLILKRPVGVNTLHIPFESQGLSRQGRNLLHDGEVVALLRRPTLVDAKMQRDMEAGLLGPEEIEPLPLDVRFEGGQLVLSMAQAEDVLGRHLEYPVEIDPPLDLQVGASLDDSYEREITGGTSPTGAYICFTSNPNATYRYWAAMRWVDASLSQDDTITTAYIRVWPYNSGYDDMNVNLHFEKTASPAQFSFNDYDITSRTRTTLSTSWIQDALGVGAFVNSPSIVIPLQELVDAYSPTAFVVIARPNTDMARRTHAHAWDYDPSHAPWLHIEFTTGVVRVPRHGFVNYQVPGIA